MKYHKTVSVLKDALVFSNKKLFQSFLQEMCIKVENQPGFSKSLLLIITDERIRRKSSISLLLFAPKYKTVFPLG